MEERQVTVDGVTYELAVPFMVVATQNPIEMEGTYPLPEAQRDRFMAQLSMGYPNEAAELMMLDTHGRTSPLDVMQAVCDARQVARLIDIVRSAARVRPGPPLRHRPGGRDAQLHRSCGSARRRARPCTSSAPPAPPPPSTTATTCCPTTSSRWPPPCCAHRLLPTAEAQIGRRTTEEIVADIVAAVPVPDDGRAHRSGG